MIVVDTNVTAYLMMEGEKTHLAQETYNRDSSWAMPSLWRHEFLNALATYVRHGGAEIEAAVEIWQRTSLLFNPGERDVDMLQALRLASQYNISTYDAQYVALAMDLGTPYVTEDRQMLKIFSGLALSMQEFCEG
jgi:predicted nucleic acid-binding protein